MRLVSYTRITSCLAGSVPSTQEITEQNERIKAYAKAHGWHVAKTYNDRKNDPKANSGFDQLLEDGVCRSFDAVIVDSIYHAGCDFPTGRQVLLQTFHYAGIGFIVVEDDYNSIGKSNREAEAYFERKDSQRESATVRTFRTACYHSGKLRKTDLIYGYDLSGDQKAVPNPKITPVIRRIFRLFDKGVSKLEIAEQLTKEKILSPTAVRRYRMTLENPYQWNSAHINYVLSQPMYSGRWTKEAYGKTWEMFCPPIVPKALYNRVQAKLETYKDQPKTPHHPYVGIIEEVGNPDQVFYLRKRPNKPERFFSYELSFSSLRLDLEILENKLKALLSAEKEKAERLLNRIREEGEEAKARMKDALRLELQAAADAIASNEKSKMDAYRRYKIGELSKEKWDAISNEAHEFVISKEPLFLSCKDRIQDIETAISEKNPWIQDRLAWEADAALDRETLHRFVRKIMIRQMELQSITLTNEEWYMKLPQEWREQYGA